MKEQKAPRITSRKKVQLFGKKKRAGLRVRKKKSNKQRTQPVLLVLVVLFGCLFLASGILLASTLLRYKQASDEYSGLVAQAVIHTDAPDGDAESRFLAVNHTLLKEANPDYMGWLDIPGTDISYPVAYASDYWEYLYTTFNKTQNNAGCIFADYRCEADWSDYSTILYGHRMNDGSMFGALKNYFTQSYLEEHSEIDVYVDGKVLVYRVFSVYQAVAADESYTTEFDDEGIFEAWVLRTAEKSAVDTGTQLNGAEHVLMLSTCKGGDNDDRTVIFAVLEETITQ